MATQLPQSIVAQASAGPLAPGSVLRLTPEEQANLDRLGYTPDTVPVAALSDFIRQITPADLGPGLTRMPPSVDIGLLAPERQAELRASIERARAAAATADAQAAAMVGTPSSPDVNRAIAALVDVAAAPATTQPPVPWLPQPQPQPQSQPQPDASAPAAVAARLPEQMRTAADNPRCPHCGQDTTTNAPQITDELKRQFLAMLAGSRFIHTYELCGGAVKLTYRNLTRAEDDAVLQQTAQDDKAAPFISPGEYIRRAENYRAAMSLAAIYVAGTGGVPGIAAMIPELPANVLTQPGSVATVAQYVDQLVTTQHLRRMVTTYGLQFAELQQACARQALSPDFWSGIVTRT